MLALLDPAEYDEWLERPPTGAFELPRQYPPEVVARRAVTTAASRAQSRAGRDGRRAAAGRVVPRVIRASSARESARHRRSGSLLPPDAVRIAQRRS